MRNNYENNDIRQIDKDDARSNDRQFVTALARGLELLRCFGPGERYIGVSEMSRRTGIPKPTVSRLAGTLNKLGYLDFSTFTGKYSLGSGVLSLGYAMLSTLDIRQMARPLMKELAEYSRASVSIGVRDRLSMVYIETVRSSSASLGTRRGVGSRLPLATTSIGRAYLAAVPPEVRSFLMDQLRLRDEQNWPQLREGIEQGLRDYAERGFCISVSDWEEDLSAVGVVFRDSDGTLMGLNCGGAAFLLTRERLENDIGPRLVSLVQRLSGTAKRN